MSLLRDPRLREIRWRDLARLSLREKLIENTITLPWLAASLWLAYHHHYLIALPCSFLFFAGHIGPLYVDDPCREQRADAGSDACRQV